MGDFRHVTLVRKPDHPASHRRLVPPRKHQSVMGEMESSVGTTPELAKPASVSFRGVFEVRANRVTQAAVDLGGRSPRHISEILLLNLQRPISKRRITEMRWDSSIEGGTDVTLKSYLSRLRCAIQPDDTKKGPTAHGQWRLSARGALGPGRPDGLAGSSWTTARPPPTRPVLTSTPSRRIRAPTRDVLAARLQLTDESGIEVQPVPQAFNRLQGP
jgi:hypothetical protein